MAYESLYRKYRSKDFGDLVGQRHVTQTLMNAIAAGRVSHAYLFCGPRGTGKTSTARVLAKALNCQTATGPTASPCDVCPACMSIRGGSAMDVIEIDAASNRNIDDIRQLREQVGYPPVELRYKFYIVDEVHQLTRDSFNAFLKTLEEPPAHVIFVLCTTDPHQLPATILSRCQRFDFHRITLEDIVERLRWVVGQEGWTVEDEALYLVARTANGGLRDALSLLDQAASYAGTDITGAHVREILGGIDFALLSGYAELILKRDANGLFTLIEGIMADGKDVPQLVAELIHYWRNLLRATIGGAETLVELNPEQRKVLAGQARASAQPAIMRAMTLLCEAENELRWNSQQRLVLELTSLRMMTEEAPVAVAAAPAAQPAVHAPQPEAPLPAAPQAVAPAPAAPAAELPPAATEAPSEANPLTLSQVKRSWPPFIEWMSKSPKLERLRTLIVEKCIPMGMLGNVLTLATASAFARGMVYDRPQVKGTLEQCLTTYFKTTLKVAVEVVEEGAPPPPAEALAPEPIAVAVAAAPAAAAEEPARDLIGDRMRKVFAGSEEISE
jgi:DNA polymerase-3 subunit gamma/tau